MSDMIITFIILFCWYLKAFENAIRFGRSDPCYEVWHIVSWLSYWIVFVWLMHYSGMNWYWIFITCAGSFLYAPLYRFFRKIEVVEIDRKYRIKWLGKILDRDGII